MDEYKKARNEAVFAALSKPRKRPRKKVAKGVDPATLPKNQLPEVPKAETKKKAPAKKAATEKTATTKK